MQPLQARRNQNPRVDMHNGGHIVVLATHPSYTHQGLASAVVSAVKEATRDRESKVMLVCQVRDLVSGELPGGTSSQWWPDGLRDARLNARLSGSTPLSDLRSPSKSRSGCPMAPSRRSSRWCAIRDESPLPGVSLAARPGTGKYGARTSAHRLHRSIDNRGCQLVSDAVY